MVRENNIETMDWVIDKSKKETLEFLIYKIWTDSRYHWYTSHGRIIEVKKDFRSWFSNGVMLRRYRQITTSWGGRYTFIDPKMPVIKEVRKILVAN